MLKETFELNNGRVIPKIGLGTWLLDNDQAEKAVISAIRLGYRMIDTAQAYENEESVGRGVKASGAARSSLFIGSKIAAENKSYASAAASIDESLQKMHLDYLDQMIIHSPQPWKEVNQSSNRYQEENLEVWRALCDAQKAGKVLSIGVSNFNESDLQNILDHSDTVPQMNQILCHISNTPQALIDFCKRNHILPEAYSPIAHGMALKNPKIAAIAEKYNVSPAQLCVRYDIQLGLVALPKTANPEHMKNNANVDFNISDQDMEVLKNIEHIKDYGDSSFFPIFGGKL